MKQSVKDVLVILAGLGFLALMVFGLGVHFHKAAECRQSGGVYVKAVGGWPPYFCAERQR